MDSAKMQTSMIVKSHEFQPTQDNLEFGKMTSSNGFGSISLKYMGNELMIKTPKLTTPFGLSYGFPGSASFGKKVEMQVNLDQSTVNNQAFFKGLLALEDLIVEQAFANKQEWAIFGNQTETKQATLEGVRAKYVSYIRPSKNPDYPSTMKLSFKTFVDKKTNKMKVTTDCHDANNEPMEANEETIVKRCQPLMVIRAKNIWILPDGTFGLKWQIERCRVYPPEERPSGGAREGEAKFSFKSTPAGNLMLDSDDEGTVPKLAVDADGEEVNLLEDD